MERARYGELFGFATTGYLAPSREGEVTNSHGTRITNPHRPDNPVVYVNAGFEQMSGYSAAQVVGRSCPSRRFATAKVA